MHFVITADFGIKLLHFVMKNLTHFSGVTLLFEHSPSRTSEIEHFDIFSHLQENKPA